MTEGTGDGTTLRLALEIRGGVSLAVWIGGAASELDALRGAPHIPPAFYADLLALGGYTGVQIDVMSGASAGGLNAVLAASAMIGQRPVARDAHHLDACRRPARTAGERRRVRPRPPLPARRGVLRRGRCSPRCAG